jgi:hypothetical protein
MNPENKVNLEEAAMKWCVKLCSCSVNVRDIEINSVANKMVNYTKIQFKASDG